MSGLSTNVFRDIVKRMQAFGLLNLQIENKVTDNIFLSSCVFEDEIVSGFLEMETAVNIARRYEHLAELFEN